MSDSPAQQAAGWYYAQGDPPGTQRYWDGNAWQGGPQAVGGGAIGGAPGGRQAAANGPRFIAFLIDWGLYIGIFIVVAIIAAVFGAVSDTLAGIVAIVGYLGAVGFAIYNIYYLQGTTGQSIGKKQQGITLLKSDTGQPVGGWMAFARSIVQGIFAIPCYLDHWWIFVDDDNRRLSDKVLDMHVYQA